MYPSAQRPPVVSDNFINESMKNAMIKKDASKETIDSWKIEQVDEQTVQLVIPKGMKIDGDGPLTIEDLKDAIEAYELQKKGPITPKCCRRRVMIVYGQKNI